MQRRHLRRHNDLVVSAIAWVEARIYVTTAFVITDAVLDRVDPRPATPMDFGLLAWDGNWYRQIAESGYLNAEDPAARFFPLWPLLGRWVGVLVGGSDVALVIMANLLAMICAVMLYRLALAETNDVDTATRTVRLFSVFPTSFVLVLAYSEALFVLLAIAMVTVMRSGRWWTAVGLGYLAGLTRPIAPLLGLSAVVSIRRSGAYRSPGAWAAVVAPSAGAATFLIWSAVALGDLWSPIERQRELRGDFADPVTRLVTAFTDAINGDKGEAFHLLAATIIVYLAVVCVRKLSADLWVFATPCVALFFSAENLNSIERYSLSVFPLIVAAAVTSRHRLLDPWVTTLSAVAMTAVTVLALSGVYVP